MPGSSQATSSFSVIQTLVHMKHFLLYNANTKFNIYYVTSTELNFLKVMFQYIAINNPMKSYHCYLTLETETQKG